MAKKSRRLSAYAQSAVLILVACGAQTTHASAPDWLRAQVGVALPKYDQDTEAAVLYSDTVLTVLPNGSMKRLQRVAIKILRPDGEKLGTMHVSYDGQSRITSLRAWSIPANGKEFELNERDAIETALFGVSNGELVSDLRTKTLRVPAAVPGNIIGYEIEQEQRPYMRIADWDFQETFPVREARFTLQLPAEWTHKSTWLNFSEQQPATASANRWQWTLANLKPIRLERQMPPWRGIAGRLSIAMTPSNGRDPLMQSWNDIGVWYGKLTQDRRLSNAPIKQQVSEVTASATTTLQKMQALAAFVQSNIRYVAIELGIGGHQPHPAADVFTNRYGDCKDKVTLLSVMLKEIGVDSHYVIINTERGAVNSSTPPNLYFNHAILAVALPKDVEDPSLLALVNHPKHGRMLFFDPTDTLTPFGRVPGGLQANFGLVVFPDGGELVALPKFSPDSNSLNRRAQMTLDAQGTLRGDVQEYRIGDLASMQREAVRSSARETDRIKPVESVMAAAFTSFTIQQASIANLRVPDKPLEWHYTIEAPSYAKVAGDLLLVRPRLLGSKSSSLLETKEPRESPIEFDRPQLDSDVFEIALPEGFEVEELPPPTKLDEGFATYQSKTEVVGNKLRFTRSFEIKELSVPVDKADKLKRFYRAIANDERMLAVLKRSAR